MMNPTILVALTNKLLHYTNNERVTNKETEVSFVDYRQ